MKIHRFNVRGLQIVLTGNEHGLTRLQIDNGTKPVILPDKYTLDTTSFIAEETQLRAYFEGRSYEFNLRLAPTGTDFQKRVWEELMNLPYGSTTTYAELAKKLGKSGAARAVGLANNRNPLPIIIPCHRVISADGSLTGYAYGLEVKQRLLEHEKINTIFRSLAEYYGNIFRSGWKKPSWWPAKSAFEMMAGAILTQNTTWSNVERALERLPQNFTPHFILNTPTDELAEMIRPSGYHNQKALKLKALCEWFRKYEFNIEKAAVEAPQKLRSELLDVKGIGPETADSILVYALEKTCFVIDTYTRRIFSRFGIHIPDNYVDFQSKIELAIPQEVEIYDLYHGYLVEHAKKFCTKTPRCHHCPLSSECKKNIAPTQQRLF